MSLFQIDIEQLTKDALDNIIKEAARQVIVEKLGSGIQTPVKNVIEAEASRLLREDVEIKQLLKDRITHWLNEQ